MKPKPSPTTYMITGEWSGPSSPAGNYTRIVHREYLRADTAAKHAFVEKVRNLNLIRYTDGTALYLHVEAMPPRAKRRPTINGYGSLIRDCISYGVNSVDALIRAKRDGGAA